MIIPNLVGGIARLIKDCIRFVFFLLRRPLYVAALLGIIIGLFYISGVPPEKIGDTVKSQIQALVENRKKTFKEDLQLIKKHYSKEQPSVPAELENELEGLEGINLDAFDEMLRPQKKKPVIPQKSREEVEQEMKEEVFGWQKAFEAAENKEVILPEDDVIQGVLSVVSANVISIQNQRFSLKVRLRSGKAGVAYQLMKRQFDGRQAKCLPDENDSQKADCFVGNANISEKLTDTGLADPL